MRCSSAGASSAGDSSASKCQLSNLQIGSQISNKDSLQCSSSNQSKCAEALARVALKQTGGERVSQKPAAKVLRINARPRSRQRHA